jgi:peptidoglycan DL-endopeptidase CwlO
MIAKITWVSIIIVGVAAIASVTMKEKPEKPTPVVKVVERDWATEDSKAYANDVVLAWAQNQYRCLDKLWIRESNWRPNAYNKIKVMGKNAGGIPQILGLDPKTPAPLQIDRGFAYIMHRYGTPCMAWKFHERKGWY